MRSSRRALLVFIIAIDARATAPNSAAMLSAWAGFVVLGVDLDDEAVEVGRDADIGAQLLGRHIHLQAVDDLGRAQGAV